MGNVLEYLEQAAERFPDRTAIGDEKGKITYRTYREMAVRIGQELRRKGLGDAGKPVGVLAERSRWIPVLFMGIVYSGNFYVPIAPELPEEKRKEIIQNAGIDLVLSSGTCLELEGQTEPGENAGTAVSGNCPETGELPLYMVYTSGSTGKPKGIVKTHEAVIDFTEAFWKVFPTEEQEVIGNQTPFFFDASAKDIYFALKGGVTLEILPSGLFSFPVKLLEYMNEKRVTMISWVPSALALVSQTNAFTVVKPETLKKVFFVGETFSVRQLDIWRRELPHTRYVNLYGFSEIAGICCYYEIGKNMLLENTDRLPIGKPLDNCIVFLVNPENGTLITKKSRIGEVYVSSRALAREYYHEPEKTRKAFVMGSFDGEEKRFFKTGDMAYYDEEDCLVFVSRKDFQIKYRGCRIELEEIETVAKKMPEIVNCGCVYIEEGQRLVLFYESSGQVTLEEKKVKLFLRTQLPAYMLPGQVKCLDKIPVNANGKTDRQALIKLVKL